MKTLNRKEYIIRIFACYSVIFLVWSFLFFSAKGDPISMFLGGLFSVAFLLGLTPVVMYFMVRRLHDINLSGWWSILQLAPILMYIVAIIVTLIFPVDGEKFLRLLYPARLLYPVLFFCPNILLMFPSGAVKTSLAK